MGVSTPNCERMWERLKEARWERERRCDKRETQNDNMERNTQHQRQGQLSGYEQTWQPGRSQPHPLSWVSPTENGDRWMSLSSPLHHWTQVDRDEEIEQLIVVCHCIHSPRNFTLCTYTIVYSFATKLNNRRLYPYCLQPPCDMRERQQTCRWWWYVCWNCSSESYWGAPPETRWMLGEAALLETSCSAAGESPSSSYPLSPPPPVSSLWCLHEHSPVKIDKSVWLLLFYRQRGMLIFGIC